MTKAAGRYHLTSADNALGVIEQLATTDRLTVAAVAAAHGIGRATAHRLLRTLEMRGFVVLSTSGRGYSAGPALLSLAMPPSSTSETRIRIRPILERVRDITAESVHTSVLVGDHVIVVDGRRSAHGIDIGLRIGMTAPAHAMAAGKLLLASLDDAQVLGLLPHESLTRRGPDTITTRTRLLSELADIRHRGWAEAHDESEADIHTVAVPLDGQTWRTRMALAISLPQDRADEDKLHVLAETMKAIVRDFEEQGTIHSWTLTSRQTRQRSS